MIKLIPCNNPDLRSYYSGTYLVRVYPEGAKVVRCDTVESGSLRVFDAGGQYEWCTKDKLRVRFFEPFYDEDGTLVGHETGRSYKRAPTYDGHSSEILEDLTKIVSDGTLPTLFNSSTGSGRIGSKFYVYKIRGVSYLYYLGEPVGLYNNGTFLVPEPIVLDRLREIIFNERLNYGLVRVSL